MNSSDKTKAEGSLAARMVPVAERSHFFRYTTVIVTVLVSFLSLFGVVIAAKSLGFSPSNFHDPSKVFDPLTMITALAVMLTPIAITILAQHFILRRPIATLSNGDFLIKSFCKGSLIGIVLKAIATAGAFCVSPTANISFAAIDQGAFNWLPCFAWFLIALVLNSLSEELCYRSFPISNLEAKISVQKFIVAVMTAVVFSIMHFLIEPPEVVHFFYRFAFGLLAATMFMHRRSLWLIVGLHTGWNFIALAVSDSEWRSGNILHLVNLADKSEGISNTIVLLLSSAIAAAITLKGNGTSPKSRSARR